MPDWITNDKIPAIIKAWHDGGSAADLAAQFGAPTRNAVIGLMHRLGQRKGRPEASPYVEKIREARRRRHAELKAERPKPEKPAPPKPSDQKPVFPATVARELPEPSPPPISAEIIPFNTARDGYPDILQIGRHQCKYPVGRNGKGWYVFCAEPTLDDHCSWCARHHAVVSAPRREPSSEKIRRRLINFG
jgi:GcrA cell cycle regulator